MGLLDWFEKRAIRKLRISQIKVLFQNEAATEFLIQVAEGFLNSGVSDDRQNLNALFRIRNQTDDYVLELIAGGCIDERETQNLLTLNNVLKLLYLADLEGKKMYRSALGQPAGDLVDFAARFSPARGWSAMSDSEWDGMVARTLSRLPKP